MNEFLNNDVDFVGAKVALLHEDSIVTILRDDIPTIPFPDMWDLPGGCREEGESPFECLRRETFEELGIEISLENITMWKYYADLITNTKKDVFAIGTIDENLLNSIKFGDEGQEYRIMKISEFLEHPKVISQFKDRLREYFEER